MIFSRSFLDPWIDFRDTLPLNLKSGTTILRQATNPKFVDFVANQTFDDMESMAACQWDRPSERSQWTLLQNFLFAVYCITRNLARCGEQLGKDFSRDALKEELGRSRAKVRIRGVMLLLLFLMHDYTSVEPSLLIIDIDQKYPPKNPRHSPATLVKRKELLEEKGIEELGEIVPKMIKMDQKSWLIKRIMRYGWWYDTWPDELTTAEETGRKRKREEEEVGDDYDDVMVVSSRPVKRRNDSIGR